MRTLASVAAVALTAAALVALPLAQPANADTCASHAEYDSLMWGLSTDQVASRLDSNGSFLGISSSGNFFKRSYNICWSPDKKAVVWYDINIGISDHWDTR